MFDSIAEKPVFVKFDRPAQSSDAGLVLLKHVDTLVGLTDTLTASLSDPRQQWKIRHQLHELVRQRIFSIAAGYFDCNDAANLGNDPVIKMICRDITDSDAPLSSQPTLSRFENGFRRADILRAALALAELAISSQKKFRRGRKPQRITIDIDPAADNTYGRQQLTFFNAYYDSYCYLPMNVTIQFDDEPDQYLVGVVLRPGNAAATKDVLLVLRRIVPLLRRYFPQTALVVRLDGEFACPELFDRLENENLLYTVNLPENPVLSRLAEPLMGKVRRRSAKSGRTERAYGEFSYAAKTWNRKRRVVLKAEVLIVPNRTPKDNPRFVATNLSWTPRNSYRWYCGRGDHENRIKELLNHMRLDLTSCTSFLANQFRCILTAAAYMLYQQLRQRAGRTEFENAQAQTLRERVIKVAALVVRTVRRIVLHLPQHYPWAGAWIRIARNCGAAVFPRPAPRAMETG